MTRKRRRLIFGFAGLIALGITAALVLTAFEESLVFFHSPSEALAKDLAPDQRIRIGGLVEEGSLTRLDDGVTVGFRVSDLKASVAVTYRGILPDLFREGQGIVAEGHLGTDGIFQADEVLAKHDETYMPPEVAEALKKSGLWRNGQGPGATEELR
jgi:cytochrome c-type biogenesis protein CcmE